MSDKGTITRSAFMAIWHDGCANGGQGAPNVDRLAEQIGITIKSDDCMDSCAGNIARPGEGEPDGQC